MDDLEDELFVYRTLAELSRQARSRALAAPHDTYVANIHVAGLMKKTSDRKSAIERHFERLVGRLSRYAKIDEVYSTLRELLEVINTDDPEANH